jgi:hypothetical protein
VSNIAELSPPISVSDDAQPERNVSSFASIAPMPSNVHAIEAALLFATGHRTKVALVGPSGWGKSHLLDAVASRISQESQFGVQVLDLQRYLASPLRYEHHPAVIIDDVQEVLGRTKLRQGLKFHLDRRVKLAKPTILAFTSPEITRQIKMLLPVSREWTIACLGVPEPRERIRLLNQMATDEGLSLSPRLIEIMARHLYGDGRQLSGALTRLRLFGIDWMDAPATLRACGLLGPFFADNAGWDLSDRILKAAEAHSALFPKVSCFEMALYTMLNEASLAESDVARIANVEPAEAHGKAVRFRKELEASSAVRTCVAQFVELVVQSIGD